MKGFEAVILAGGGGERFWPLSTQERPKQFLHVFGGESLIRQSVSRLKGIANSKHIHVITSKSLINATIRELGELPRENITGEPMRRDTGAAVALGVGMASFKDDDVIGFFASDQLVMKPAAFRRVLRSAIAKANATDAIVVIGIQPTYASDAFGYVDPAKKTFVEKPDLKTAKKYLKKGFLWNAGMFIAKASVFRKAISEFAPELAVLSDASIRGKDLAAIYGKLPRLSFDYAVMERASQAGMVEVVPGDFGWDDVGSFIAFDKYFPHDRNRNVREGPCTVVESEGNICIARNARISLLGVKDLVVVTTSDSVLVADKNHISDMKKLFK